MNMFMTPLLFYLLMIRLLMTKVCLVLDGQPLLASGGSSGVICIWNLEKRRLQTVIREAHDGSIVSLHFFANEPVLMSSSTDNSIKVRNVASSNFLMDISKYSKGS